jgi:hypothetical protein
MAIAVAAARQKNPFLMSQRSSCFLQDRVDGLDPKSPIMKGVAIVDRILEEGMPQCKVREPTGERP